MTGETKKGDRVSASFFVGAFLKASFLPVGPRCPWHSAIAQQTFWTCGTAGVALHFIREDGIPDEDDVVDVLTSSRINSVPQDLRKFRKLRVV
jgi:hypothetical protein